MTRVHNGAVVAVIAVLVLIQVSDLLLRTVNGDYSAYALPAANWVMTGQLAIPQLGPQFELDREWRFNSPLIGGGPALFFWAGEIGQDWYLFGCGLQVVVGGVGFLILVRRALAGHGWLLAAGVTFALLTERQYLSELVNQRYTIVAYVAVAALYFPARRSGPHAPWWQWWLAGFLPLIHPCLLIGSVVWVLAEVATFIRERALTAGAFGLVGFLLGVVLTYAWYLDPHLLCNPVPPAPDLSGLRPVLRMGPAGELEVCPTEPVDHGRGVACGRARVGSWPSRRTGAVSPRAGDRAVALVLALDARGNMAYLSYYLLGVAPAALACLAGTPWQRRVALIWCGLAVLQCGTELKLNPPDPVRPITRSATRDFLVEHTRPGDLIVVGPPFTLAAAEPDLPNGRRIVYVVPMPLFLKDFDVDLFLADIRSRCTVYVGSPCYFAGVQKEYKRTSPRSFHVGGRGASGLPADIRDRCSAKTAGGDPNDHPNLGRDRSRLLPRIPRRGHPLGPRHPGARG